MIQYALMLRIGRMRKNVRMRACAKVNFFNDDYFRYTGCKDINTEYRGVLDVNI